MFPLPVAAMTAAAQTAVAEVLGEPCGAVDPITGAVCTCRVKHEVHKDESPDFVITWAEPKTLVTT